MCVPEALEILADAVLNPKFQSWEVAEQVRHGSREGKNSVKMRAQMGARYWVGRGECRWVGAWKRRGPVAGVGR